MQQPADGVSRVRDDAGEGGAQDVADVLLVCYEIYHRNSAVLGGQQIKERIEGLLPSRSGYLSDGAALKGAVFRPVQARGADVLEADEQGDVLEVLAALHPLTHPRALCGVLQSPGQGLGPSRLELRRQDVDELRRARGVGVDVARDLQALLPRPVDEPEHLRHREAPIAAAYGFEVAYFQREAQLPRHGEHLPQRLHHPVALLPHVYGDDGAAIAQRFQRPDESGRVVKALRRVAESQRDADRPARKALLQQGVDLRVLRPRQRRV